METKSCLFSLNADLKADQDGRRDGDGWAQDGIYPLWPVGPQGSQEVARTSRSWASGLFALWVLCPRSSDFKRGQNCHKQRWDAAPRSEQEPHCSASSLPLQDLNVTKKHGICVVDSQKGRGRKKQDTIPPHFPQMSVISIRFSQLQT